MEIPKAKILIYALTFVGYIWSGYGTNVLSHLRDAVIAAEDIFGNFLLKFDEVITKVKNVHDTIDSSLDEECLWSCPNGANAVSNRYSKPRTNGCGPEGLNVNIESPFYSDMVKCCNTHDVCYGTCNTLKEKCDLVFKRCLYSACENKNFDALLLKGCKGAAKMLHTATQTMGCKFFKDAQNEACYCPEGKRKRYPAGEL